MSTDSVYRGACFIEHARMGPTVYVGPFVSVEQARAWIKTRADVGWVIVPLQDPAHQDTPDWS